ncbi:uncharacterized protein A1O9_07710 [Exophiala aquamarina CBS 119918]|uniref:Uncharacterized protein n=1 Tax=Exophiala aquamarina CBS 119918 TaxID=1182545 RepID=A0A072P7M0_9EURO|nr:uncharacterized protein A1O9_07710 [Exophiala aquamarina CBS 119918]KEF56129.1 hypothetical protein A1O9_07710 [Exophiala aquamarina CBS 119918]
MSAIEAGRQTWMGISSSAMITLGSKTKSFLKTHFRSVHFPVPFDKVSMNSGLKFEFYDTATKLWPSEHSRAITFNHHCAIPRPQASPFAKIEYPSRLMETVGIPKPGGKFIAANAVFDSNEILAGQPRCPKSLSLQEFVAFQSVICKFNRFWPALLIEMGSSNLNLSSEAVMIILESLCARTDPEDSQDVYSQIKFFQGDAFCNALASQIDKRLTTIRSNWRDHCSMSILITLILKVLGLGSTSVRVRALELLGCGWDTTIQWTRLLRKESWSTTNVATSRRLSQLIL